MLDQEKIIATNLHKCLLIITAEIKRICEENSIKYFLIGGSLLGAVRHGGFIPWDDDIDIGMLRNDYTKFQRCCENGKLNKEFSISSFNSEDNYGVPFLKIRLNDTHFKETENVHAKNDGIFVDVFPIDRYPDGRYAREIQCLFIKYLRDALLYKCDYNLEWSLSKNISFNAKVNHAIIKLIACQSIKLIRKELQKAEEKYNNRTTKYYINYGSSYKLGKEIFLSFLLDENMQHVAFENLVLPIPIKPEIPLNQLYGDYMVLPPEEKRVFKHSCGMIDFGKYK